MSEVIVIRGNTLIWENPVVDNSFLEVFGLKEYACGSLGTSAGFIYTVIAMD